MATLQELVDQISKLPGVVKLGESSEDYLFYKFYTVYWKREADIVDSESICIYIENRGTPAETAYFKGSKPQVLRSAPPAPFADLLKTKISEFQAANPGAEKVEIVSIDEQNELAHINAFVFDPASKTSVKKSVVAFKKDSVIIFRILM